MPFQCECKVFSLKLVKKKPQTLLNMTEVRTPKTGVDFAVMLIKLPVRQKSKLGLEDTQFSVVHEKKDCSTKLMYLI